MSSETFSVEDVAKPESEEELLKRLPELSALRGNVRDETIRIFMEDVPGYFWVARAAEKYHPPDERGLGGLWLHTKRTFFALTVLERSFRAMSTIDSMEANCARAAILLHDVFKYGVEPDNDDEEDYHEYANGYLSHLERSNQRHDLDMAEHIRENSDLPDQVAQCVETHGGSASWFSHEGPTPRNDLQLMHHLADLNASHQENEMPVWRPHHEMQMMTGGVKKIQDEEWLEELDYV